MVQVLKPEEVTQRYGTLFCRGIFTLVDEKNGVAQVIEECSAKGPVEWDACNRKRAGGAITDITVEGNTIIMDTSSARASCTSARPPRTWEGRDCAP